MAQRDRGNKLCSIIKMKLSRFTIKQNFMFVDIIWKIKVTQLIKTQLFGCKFTYEAAATAFLGVASVPDNKQFKYISLLYIIEQKYFHFKHIWFNKKKWSTFSKASLEPSGHMSKMPHATCPGSLSSNSLHTPVI